MLKHSEQHFVDAHSAKRSTVDIVDSIVIANMLNAQQDGEEITPEKVMQHKILIRSEIDAYRATK